jgi:hypothetical protein
MPKKEEWSNEVTQEPTTTAPVQPMLTTPPMRQPVRPEQRESVFEPSQRDDRIKALAEQRRNEKIGVYDITNENERTPRVVYDHYGNTITIDPLKTKFAVVMRERLALALNRPLRDIVGRESPGLRVVPSAAAADAA